MPDPATLFVVSGIQGAGKSTVARLLAARYECGAWVSADALQRMIIAGGRWPEGANMSDAARHQLRLRLSNACTLARSFAAAGFTAVVDDIILGERVEHLLEDLDGQPFAFVVLAPSIEAVRRREAVRGTELWREWAWLDDELRQRTRRLGLWLDTTDLTAEQTVDAILERKAEALVGA